MQLPTQLLTAHQATRTYFLTVVEGIKIDALLDRSYWAHVARLLQPGYKVEVLCEDLTWWGVLICLDSGKNEALMVVLDHKELQADALEVSSEYEVKFRGLKKFSIVRKPDGAVVEEGIPTKADAIARLAERMKAA